MANSMVPATILTCMSKIKMRKGMSNKPPPRPTQALAAEVIMEIIKMIV
jgi:hypothetical protein